MDEHRGAFSPTLWYFPPGQVNNATKRTTHLKQCWFAGVHTDVGRGYEDHVPGDIADITFAWMVDQCRDLLAFNEKKVPQMLEKGDFKQPEDEEAKKRREERVRKAKTWGLAALHDSMTLVFKMGQSMDRTPGQYAFKARKRAHETVDNPGSGGLRGGGFITMSEIVPDSPPEAKPWHSRVWRAAWGVFTGPLEDLSKLDPVWTAEVIHPSVRLRMMQDKTYDPPALRDFKLKYDADRSRWTWVKKWEDTNGIVRETTLHEDRIEDSSFSLSKVTAESLKFGIDKEEPLPPRQKNGSWFSFW